MNNMRYIILFPTILEDDQARDRTNGNKDDTLAIIQHATLYVLIGFEKNSAEAGQGG